MLDGLVVAPRTSPRLAERATDEVAGLTLKKADAPAALAACADKLALLQQRLFAEDERALLLVLQGIDTSGKDGAIKNVFRGITPSAFQVTSYKAPSSSELAHDYLWRIHAACPKRGHIGIFNRSHYEDVVTAPVLGIVKGATVRRRYRHINDFERLLHDEGTTIVKVFLHLSKGEQRERLQARLDDPEKRWKFRMGDLDVRAQWDAHVTAYEQAIAATSTTVAPWHIVPADKKWLRDVVVAQLVVDALERMDPQLPPDDPAIDGLVME